VSGEAPLPSSSERADGDAADPVVAVDCNGADLGPREVAEGAAIAAASGARVLLFGPAAELGEPSPGVEIVDAPLSIAKSEDPAGAARATPQASIVMAARAVADGRAQALVCAGGTGAALAAGTFNIKRDRGVYRPALALPLPVPGRPVTLLDVGASVEARREHLVQFAFMGAALARIVLGVARPRVGLLSNGEEAERGSELVVQTGAELRERTSGGLDAF
jgi:glycerol-3-phosphate acyltransferase PlsX